MAEINLTSPAYYTSGNIEVWDFIRDQRLNYHLGCVIKYLCRAGRKTDDKLIDLTKALHYLQNEIDNCQPRNVPSVRHVPDESKGVCERDAAGDDTRMVDYLIDTGALFDR